jgi:hypothetical protein
MSLAQLLPINTGGEVIGRGVAEKPGWHLFDREILEAIARTTRTRERLLSRLDASSGRTVAGSPG